MLGLIREAPGRSATESMGACRGQPVLRRDRLAGLREQEGLAQSGPVDTAKSWPPSFQRARWAAEIGTRPPRGYVGNAR